MMVWKMICLFQGCILRFHVNLPGCIPLCTGFHTMFLVLRRISEPSTSVSFGMLPCHLFQLKLNRSWSSPEKKTNSQTGNVTCLTPPPWVTSNISVYHINIPGTQMTSIFESQPPKTGPTFQSKQGSVGFQVHIPHITHINDDEPSGFNERSRRSLPPFNQPIRRVDI